MNRRDAVLTATKAAEYFHRRSKTQEHLSKHPGSVNVFGAVMESGAALIFRPLDNLLGACLVEPAPGVIVTTQRPLPIQRFTGAHELGHLALKHRSSVDGQEILTGHALNDLAELQANTFATAFLIPSWLVTIHTRIQGWQRADLQVPDVVYQLSLRVGASYKATLIALRTHRFIDPAAYDVLAAVPPKEIKQRLLDRYIPENWRGNVWHLTDKDQEISIEGQDNDIFVVRLNEKSGAGYLWTLSELQQHQFKIVEDQRLPLGNEGSVGGSVERVMTMQPETNEAAGLAMALKRPWEPNALEQYFIKCDLHGKEEGHPRALRTQLSSAA